jgi:hypothetical protein
LTPGRRSPHRRSLALWAKFFCLFRARNYTVS